MPVLTSARMPNALAMGEDMYAAEFAVREDFSCEGVS